MCKGAIEGREPKHNDVMDYATLHLITPNSMVAPEPEPDEDISDILAEV